MNTNMNKIPDMLRAYENRALDKRMAQGVKKDEYHPWCTFKLSKAERKGKTVEQIAIIRENRWKAERVIQSMGLVKAMEYGVVNANRTFNEAKYTELLEMAREAQAEAQRLDMIKKLEPVKVSPEELAVQPIKAEALVQGESNES